MLKFFRPKRSERSGAQVTFLTATLPDIADTATTTIRIPTPFRRQFVEKASVNLSTIGISAGGTVLATLKKHDASADSEVTLSSALSLESDGVATANEAVAFSMLSTATDVQRTIEEGDTLYVEVVAAAAVGTDPVGSLIVESLVLE